MKKQILMTVFIVLASSLARASFKEQFQQSSEFESVIVDGVELVYGDQLTERALFKVSFSVSENCQEEDMSCRQCHYAWAEFSSQLGDQLFIENTQKPCSTHIEEILNPQVQDEY